MDRYVVMVVDTDEDRWESLSEQEKQLTYDADGRFLKLLAERGGRLARCGNEAERVHLEERRAALRTR